MSMSWLIVMFVLNGVPTVSGAFPPLLVPTSECHALQLTTGQVMALAFPNSVGMAFCLPDHRSPEDTSVPA